jgi:cyclase
VKLEQLSDSCFAVLNGEGRLCESNSGFIHRGGGVVVDTQCDLFHAKRLVAAINTIAQGMPKRVINTNESGDHAWGNQVFAGAEIIAHRSGPERKQHLATPQEFQALVRNVHGAFSPMMLKAPRPGVLAIGRQLRQGYDFEGIVASAPGTLFDERLELDVDGLAVHLIHVGPCHEVGDTIVHVPAEGVVFAGDVVFRQCTPMGWCGNCAKWLQALDLIIWLDPDVVVPGHGPLCGIEGAMDMKAYLEYVQDESRRFFDQGLTAMEAAKRIELGPYREWKSPARVIANVESAYREFRNEPADAPWSVGRTFDSMFEVAKARGLEVEF